MDFSSILSPSNIKQQVDEWLREDISSFDFGSCLFGEEKADAVLLMKEPGVLAGVPFVNVVINEMDCEIEWLRNEGEYVDKVPVTVAKVRGLTREVLRAERLSLNILARACGIATLAYHMSAAVKSINWSGLLAGTRRTTPGFRLVEKYALLVGGADPHRFDLSSMIMLKNNHIEASGGIDKAVAKARKIGGFSMKVEVECKTLEEALAAAEAGTDLVRLDDMTVEELKPICVGVKHKYPKVAIEASGNITVDNIKSFAMPFVDILGSRILSQGYGTLDLSMKIVPPKH